MAVRRGSAWFGELWLSCHFRVIATLLGVSSVVPTRDHAST